MHHPRRSRLAAFVVAAGALLTIPASAQAVGLTILDDAGNAVPFAADGPVRQMSEKIGFAPANGELYTASVTGPDGAPAMTAINCFSIPTSRSTDFRGNGVYTVTVQAYGAKDFNCATPVGAPVVRRYTVVSSVALSGPAEPFLIRQPGSFVTQPVALPFAGNPGALTQEIRYAEDAALGPDGGLSVPGEEAFVDTATSTVPLRLTSPGRYVVVARAKGYTAFAAGGQFFSPWTAPVVLNAMAPFDFESSRVVDSRGPSYRIRMAVREKSATGRVAIAYARGSKGGRYRSLGSVKIGRKGVFTKRFTLTRTGTYRLRFRYEGNATVAGGSVVQKFRISRRFVF
jgi:hypothetical protein